MRGNWRWYTLTVFFNMSFCVKFYVFSSSALSMQSFTRIKEQMKNSSKVKYNSDHTFYTIYTSNDPMIVVTKVKVIPTQHRNTNHEKVENHLCFHHSRPLLQLSESPQNNFACCMNALSSYLQRTTSLI